MSLPDQYGVFGNPIQHSKSPIIHALFAEQTGQNLDYRKYLAPLNGFAQSIHQFAESGGLGANVTVPFKIEAFQLADVLSERARMAGAVNTLSFREGKIVGDNTDGAGLVRDIVLNARCPIAGCRVLLLGAGGAARGAILPLLEQNPVRLDIANRTKQKAEDLINLAKREISGGAPIPMQALSWEQLNGNYDVVINATSASLHGDLPPISASIFADRCLAYDMMYGDQVTPFNQFATLAGAQIRDGLGMLVEQAAEAFWIWRGIRPETLKVINALRPRVGV
ncbi:shikimate dehydrogenase [Undibacterium fentianense]|uniref:Shikimate dehydrogenase (NADP(+)) n=1 Tax=Undibacterium fentianense TaxID=2828728 RepID=A0A941E145_9BURK|nr:shikimate dehydrogenase [Undibacterium fentianense]MBR7799342.1 shikimate dehydrogenase [Undibacterium fentianense]